MAWLDGHVFVLMCVLRGMPRYSEWTLSVRIYVLCALFANLPWAHGRA